MTEIREYAESIASQIRNLMPDVTVDVQEIIKNNDQKMIGICIKKTDTNIAPNIYINSFYEDKVGVFDAAQKVIGIYNKSAIPGIDVNIFTNYNAVKDRIIFRLVNKGANKEMFEKNNIVYKDFLDLAIIYAVRVSSDGENEASFKVTQGIMDTWGVTLDDVDKVAKENTPKLSPVSAMSLTKMLEDMGYPLGDMGSGDNPLYVMTNDNKLNGAATILYPDVFSKFIDENNIEDDLCIIPSSIHEVILYPMNEFERLGIIADMIKEINQSEVSPEERLSDHPYIYKRETKEIIAA